MRDISITYYIYIYHSNFPLLGPIPRNVSFLERTDRHNICISLRNFSSLQTSIYDSLFRYIKLGPRWMYFGQGCWKTLNYFHAPLQNTYPSDVNILSKFTLTYNGSNDILISLYGWCRNCLQTKNKSKWSENACPFFWSKCMPVLPRHLITTLTILKRKPFGFWKLQSDWYLLTFSDFLDLVKDLFDCWIVFHQSVFSSFF